MVGIIKWLIIWSSVCRCQTCCLGDRDSCNTYDDFDNMNSVKVITDVMFKINPAVAFCIIILINQMVCYNKTNTKLLPVIFLFSQLSRSRSQVKCHVGETNDPVIDDFTF